MVRLSQEVLNRKKNGETERIVLIPQQTHWNFAAAASRKQQRRRSYQLLLRMASLIRCCCCAWILHGAVPSSLHAILTPAWDFSRERNEPTLCLSSSNEFAERGIYTGKSKLSMENGRHDGLLASILQPMVLDESPSTYPTNMAPSRKTGYALDHRQVSAY